MLRAMAEAPPHAVRCLKEAGVHSVWLVQRPGQPPRTIKGWPLTAGLLLKLLLGIAQPQRQIRGARRLRRAGAPTPRVFGSWRFARRGKTRLVEIELEYVPGRSAFDVLAEAAPGDDLPRRCARPIGRLVAALASARLLHRDLKLRNVIVNEEDQPPSVWIIDSVGVRRYNDLPMSLLRMLDRLLVEAAADGLALPASVWRPVLHAALGDQDPLTRRLVVVLLRRHLPRLYGPSRTASDADRQSSRQEETARPG
jgi:hypothetical protein